MAFGQYPENKRSMMGAVGSAPESCELAELDLGPHPRRVNTWPLLEAPEGLYTCDQVNYNSDVLIVKTQDGTLKVLVDGKVCVAREDEAMVKLDPETWELLKSVNLSNKKVALYGEPRGLQQFQIFTNDQVVPQQWQDKNNARWPLLGFVDVKTGKVRSETGH